MSDAVNIVIGGDLFPVPINYDLFIKGKAEEIFGKEICKLFADSDFAVCNLEGCFTDENTLPKLKDGPNINAPIESIHAIKKLGVDCVSLANNHATDYGLKGLLDTKRTLESAGITYFGAGENLDSVTTFHSVTLNGINFIFYGVSETIENVPTAVSPGVNIYEEFRVCKEIEALRKKCDYLIVLYHGGIENIHFNTESIRNRFHRMADNGADIVISQHTHAIGEEEYYRDSYLLYGQGNFCFHFSKKNTEWTETALLLDITFTRSGFKVNKHLVRRCGPIIHYEPENDLSDFKERSRRLASGEKFEKEFRDYADEKLVVYLHAFRGKNLFDKIVRKLLPKEKYLRYLRSQYSQKQILKILLALQCEEFNEVAVRGMKNLLEESQKKTNER